MKSLFQKDKQLRKKIVNIEKKQFILKAIFKNFNFLRLIRWNAFLKLRSISVNSSKVLLSNRCLYGINKKRFNKFSNFSRNIFLKLIRSGQINGFKKASW